MRKTLQIIFSVLFFLITPFLALADDFNYQAYPVGEQAAGMGGAHVGLSETPEGTFYNPGGLAFAKDSSISLSATVLRLTKGTINNAVTITTSTGQVAANLPVSTTEIIPTSTVFLKIFNYPWEKKSLEASGKKTNTFAFSLYLPDSTAQEGKINFTQDSVQTFLSYELKNTTILVGPSLSRRLTENLGVGFSLFYLNRAYKLEHFSQVIRDTFFSQAFLSNEYSYNGLLGLVGVKLRLPYNLEAGFSARTPSFKLFSDGTIHNVSRNTDSADASDKRTNNNYGGLNVNLPSPIQFALGLAWRPAGRFSISGDALFYLPNEFTAVSDPKGRVGTLKIKQEFNVNGNVGFEYLWRNRLAFRAGAFSDFSSAPMLGTSGSGTNVRINYYGGTANIGYLQKHSTISVGGQYSLGDGELIGAGGRITGFRLHRIGVMLAGSHRF